MPISHIIIVGLGGFLGAIARYLIVACFHSPAHASSPSMLPWGTLIVNITGCLILGLILGILERMDTSPHELRLFFVIGICGGFTTFSAFIYEIHTYLKEGLFFPFILYLFLSCIGGILFLFLGHSITSSSTP